MDAPAAVAPPMPPEDFGHCFCQRLRPLFFCRFQITVEAAFADLQNPAQRRDGKVLCFDFDEAKNLGQVWRLKMLKAFFKMSRSISVCLSLALRRRISCSSAEPLCDCFCFQ